MDCFDARHCQESVSDSGVADTNRSGLHDDRESVPEDADGGGQHQDAEDEGADGVNYHPAGLEVNYQGSNKNT